MKMLLLKIIHLYQYLLSPWVGSQCRFHPTCSEYARVAIEDHGAAKGSWLASKRLCKCHPWHQGGFDPVPGREKELQQQLQQQATSHADQEGHHHG